MVELHLMDPNALLNRILELCKDHSDYGFLPSDEADEVVEGFKELHRWIMSGGFPPALWADKLDLFRSAPTIQSDDPWQNTASAHTPPF
jgi:hypothetical protein